MRRTRPLHPRLLRASDGASLRVSVSEGPPGSPWVLLLGAPGTPPSFWTHQVEHLGARRSVVALEYPEVVSPTTRATSAERLLLDAVEALDALGIERAALVSWGLGAQAALDLVGQRPGRFTQLVAVNPLLSPRFARAMGVLRHDPVGPLLGRIAARATPLLARAHQRLSFIDAGAWLRRAGLASPTIEREALDEVIRDLGALSNAGIGRALAALEAQRQGPEPEKIELPALFIVGEADVVASDLLARRLARRMPHGEVLSIKGGTHLTPLEYPEYVSLAIERFLAPAP